MTSLARYEFVLVPGPHGINRLELLRTPKPTPRPNRDALPLNVPFIAPAPVPPEPTSTGAFPERAARTPGTPKPPKTPTPKYMTLACSQCGTSYRSRARFVQGERHYCGPDCRHKAWVAMRAERRRAERPEPPVERYCEECQQLIPPTPAGVPYQAAQRFCSPPCQERAATRRQRQATHHAQ